MKDNTKITLTLKQLKHLVKESVEEDACAEDFHPARGSKAPFLKKHIWDDDTQSGEVEFFLGKVADPSYYKSGRKSCSIVVSARIDKNGQFGASGDIWNASGSDINRGGQCLDDIGDHNGDYYPQLPKESQEILDILVPLWEKHHLNGTRAGTPEQMAASDEWEKETGKTWNSDYDGLVDFLKGKDLYVVDDPERPGEKFEFGSRWLKWGIPKDDMEKILDLVRDGHGLTKESVANEDSFDAEDDPTADPDKPEEKIKKWYGDTKCDFCHRDCGKTLYDGMTGMGPWAVMCEPCFHEYGVGLGLGKGQKYKKVGDEYIQVDDKRKSAAKKRASRRRDVSDWEREFFPELFSEGRKSKVTFGQLKRLVRESADDGMVKFFYNGKCIGSCDPEDMRCPELLSLMKSERGVVSEILTYMNSLGDPVFPQAADEVDVADLYATFMKELDYNYCDDPDDFYVDVGDRRNRLEIFTGAVAEDRLGHAIHEETSMKTKRIGRISENTKVTLTMNQLKKLVKESYMPTTPPRDEKDCNHVANAKMTDDEIDYWSDVLAHSAKAKSPVKNGKETLAECTFDDGCVGKLVACTSGGTTWLQMELYDEDGHKLNTSDDEYDVWNTWHTFTEQGGWYRMYIVSD